MKHVKLQHISCGCVDLPESMVQVQPRILAHIIDKDTLVLWEFVELKSVLRSLEAVGER